MIKRVTVHSLDELNYYKNKVVSNLNKCSDQLSKLTLSKDSFALFQTLKFKKCVTDPFSGEAENFIEVVNQSMTYIVSIIAAEYLLNLYPDKTFILNLGNISGNDIISDDGTVICECFAASSYRSNKKLTLDLERLKENSTAEHKYEIFYDEVFTSEHQNYYANKYPDITIIKLEKLN